jgi:hypothetical protein
MLAALLPSTVIVAVALFVLKEAIEAVRRWRAQRRQIKAFKILLARECELNQWANMSLKRAINEIAGGGSRAYS